LCPNFRSALGSKRVAKGEKGKQEKEVQEARLQPYDTSDQEESRQADSPSISYFTPKVLNKKIPTIQKKTQREGECGVVQKISIK